MVFQASIALFLSMRRWLWGTGSCGGAQLNVLSDTQREWTVGVSGLN
jgi:hypothetical protein